MTTAAFEWGVAQLTLPGEHECGDKYVVEPFEGGALVAVVDALGHGREAARVADAAVATLVPNAKENLDVLMQRCHSSIRETRGATMSLASFDWRQRTMTWLGVGNVVGVLMRNFQKTSPRIESLLVRAGVVGYQLPDPHPLVMPIEPGDTLILATDGVRDLFTEILPAVIEPQRLANRILTTYAKHRDDATVLVFRCNGSEG